MDGLCTASENLARSHKHLRQKGMSDHIGESSFNDGTMIKVIGVGGGGGNAVEHMMNSNVQGVEFICANTDAQALERVSAHRTVQLGRTGLGAGSKPDAGRLAAEDAIDDIRECLAGAHMVFVTAGMGGGTGTGAAPVIARVAKEMGILTVGVVTKPFEWEGRKRMENAEAGLAELQNNVDSLIVVLNDKLLEVLGEEVTQEEAFAEANDILRNAVGGISDIIHVPGHVNVDFEDVRTIMSEPGKAMMGTATAQGPDRAIVAAKQAIACPLLDGVNLQGAKGVLVLITASRGSLKLAESRTAMNAIRAHASPEAHIIYGTAYDDSLGDKLRVTVIATGLQPEKATAGEISTSAAAPTPAPSANATPSAAPALATQRGAAYAGAIPAAPVPGAAAPSAATPVTAMDVPAIWRTHRDPSAGASIPSFLRTAQN